MKRRVLRQYDCLQIVVAMGNQFIIFRPSFVRQGAGQVG